MRKPKTQFGIEVREFTARTGLTVRAVASGAGVSYATLMDTSVGRSAGHELIPKVRKFMAEYTDSYDKPATG